MMEIEDLMYKQKLLANNINTTILFIGVLVFGLFLRLTLLMSFMFYPLFSLLIYGTLKIRKGFTKKLKELSLKILNILFGIGCILFGIWFLIFLFSYPNVDLIQLIYLIAFPVIIVGIAGVVKGFVIREYLFKYRAMNIYIGIITVIISIITFILAENFFIIHISSLTIAILLNIISRAAMYLSQYKLSLKLANLRYFFYIINDYPEYEIFRRIMLRNLAHKK
ncbi:MAG: hypothetical protein ACFE8M_01365 [Candidatus Hermodarchaeota archaeon]